MSKIRQNDIYPGSISFTKSSNFSITNAVATPQSNLTASAYSLGTASGMATTDPLSIKEFGTNTNIDWSDEQDWTVYNQSFTNTIPVVNVSASVSIYTTSTNASISVGDLVGIYGPGSWTISGNTNLARYASGAGGQQASALVTGGTTDGNVTLSTELFNGSSWNNTNPLNIFSQSTVGGSQIAAYATGSATNTQLFNGTIWSFSGNISDTRVSSASGGSQNAGIIAGGITTAVSSKVELFNGSSWSVASSVNLAKQYPSGSGSVSAMFYAAGATQSNINNNTELFNGSSWAFSGNIVVAKFTTMSAGSSSCGIIADGSTSVGATPTNQTEHFNGSNWYSSTLSNGSKRFVTGTGSQNATVLIGGLTAGATSQTELYNQNIYRKIVNMTDFRSAQNIGIAFDVTSTTLSVKFNGYIDNINVTSSNSAITTVAQWINKFVTLPRFSPNASTTNNPSSIIVKSVMEPEDFLIGWAISRTQMQVFNGNIFNHDRIGGW